jgi:ASC-1-like (ASCH) protein
MCIYDDHDDHHKECHSTLVWLYSKWSLNRGDFTFINIGDQIKFFDNENSDHWIIKTVVKLEYYSTFLLYLKKVGLSSALPGVSSVEAGELIYHQFYTPEMERQYGIVAIYIN